MNSPSCLTDFRAHWQEQDLFVGLRRKEAPACPNLSLARHGFLRVNRKTFGSQDTSAVSLSPAITSVDVSQKLIS